MNDAALTEKQVDVGMALAHTAVDGADSIASIHRSYGRISVTSVGDDEGSDVGLHLLVEDMEGKPRPLTRITVDYLTAVALLAAHQVGGLRHKSAAKEGTTLVVMFEVEDEPTN